MTRSASMSLTVTLAAVVSVLCGCMTKSPAHEQHRFLPISRSMEPWGALEFDNRRMQLESLQGTMSLEYVGALPETAGKDLEGAAVYRIKNAAKYFEKNRDKESFCPQAAQWVALNSKAGAPAWSSEIFFALLTLDDWSRYEPGNGDSCASGKYVRGSAAD